MYIRYTHVCVASREIREHTHNIIPFLFPVGNECKRAIKDINSEPPYFWYRNRRQFFFSLLKISVFFFSMDKISMSAEPLNSERFCSKADTSIAASALRRRSIGKIATAAGTRTTHRQTGCTYTQSTKIHPPILPFDSSLLKSIFQIVYKCFRIQFSGFTTRYEYFTRKKNVMHF